ncbi:MAG: flagellar motor protein MotB [Bacteroidetes bacterium]|jgi:outer membrane protein OmpA-like peptidoglycan-associated protein|nr:flagellar motor protein MotB [Bacteroidota bacterium]
MKIKLSLIFFILAVKLFSQTVTTGSLKAGDKAPPFVLQVQQNSIQSFAMPYLNRILLIHFWSSTVSKSKAYNKYLNRLAGRYKNALYRNADGFEIIAIAVQSDRRAWDETVRNDSLSNFINGIANRGYNDEICKKFGVGSVPHDILIDETGTIIAINPRIRDIEDMLDERKNFQPIKKDVIGTLAMSSDPADLLKFGKLFLFDAYGDSVSKTTTNNNGAFTFSDIKLNQDFILKVDNGTDIVTSDPLALYTSKGEKILEGKTMEGGFVFYIPSNTSFKLTENSEEHTLGGGIGQVNVIKDLIFKNNGAELTPKDEKELNSIFLILSKNKSLSVEITTHTDTKFDDKTAMDLTTKQCATIKNYFVKKGITTSRLKLISKGRSQPRKACKTPADCTEDDHKQNRRVEFLVYKS